VICRDWRVIFVHQRKSAGTSVKALFPPVEGPDRGRFNSGLLDPTWDDPEFDGWYRFTVVRNPWDRFVSAWNYCRSTRGRPILDVIENLPQPDLCSNVLAPRQSLRARLRYALELRTKTGYLLFVAGSIGVFVGQQIACFGAQICVV